MLLLFYFLHSHAPQKSPRKSIKGTLGGFDLFGGFLVNLKKIITSRQKILESDELLLKGDFGNYILYTQNSGPGQVLKAGPFIFCSISNRKRGCARIDDFLGSHRQSKARGFAKHICPFHTANVFINTINLGGLLA